MPVLLRWLWTLGPGNPMTVTLLGASSRRQSHLWVRCGYLGVLSLIAIIALLASGGAGTTSLADLAKAGGWVFTVVAYTQVVAICLLAPLMMAAAVGRDDPQTTRDILHTTPLTNLQLVLGPLVGRLFMIWTLLASGLPLFAVLVVVGGVPTRAILIAFAVAGLSALAVGAAAVALSVFGRGGRRSVYSFVVLTVAFLVAGYAVDRLLRESGTRLAAGAVGLAASDAGGSTTILTPLHPLLVLEASLGGADYQPPDIAQLTDRGALARLYQGRPFAAFSLLTLAGGVGLIGLCALRVRRTGQRDGGLPRRGWFAGPRRASAGEEGVSRRRALRTVWVNPVAWCEAHARPSRWSSQVGRWLFFIVGSVGVAVLLWLYHTGALGAVSATSDPATALHAGLLAILLLEMAVIVLVAVYVSAGSVSREREAGTLDLLLTTPITPRRYLWGKLRGLVSFLAVLLATPIVGLAMVAVYTLIGLAMQWPQARPRFEIAAFGAVGSSRAAAGVARFALLPPEVALLFPLLLVPFVALCVAVGMSYSIRARGVLGAVASTLGVMSVLAVIGGFCGLGAAENIPVFGPVLNAFNPATALLMLVNPWQRVAGFAADPTTGRVGLAMAALAGAGVYTLIVKLLLGGMVRQFDHSVRRLSG